MKSVLLAFVFVIGLATSFAQAREHVEYTIEGVVRVFLHDVPSDEAPQYSVMTEDGNALKLHKLWGQIDRLDCIASQLVVHVLKDVPADKHMYAHVDATNYGNLDRYWCVTVTIHVHSADDINGAGWERQIKSGKTTHTVEGKTQVVE